MNSSDVLKITARANPAITKYTWTKKGGRELPPSSAAAADQRISASGPSLFINNVREADGGTYTLTAENPIGRTRKSFRVNIEYPPR